jgi:hypothetical protein
MGMRTIIGAVLSMALGFSWTAEVWADNFNDPAPGEDQPGAEIASLKGLTLLSASDLYAGEQAGGGAEQYTPPSNDQAAGKAQPPAVQSPLLKKLTEKGVLTPEEASQIQAEEKGKSGSFLNSLAQRITLSGLSYFGYSYRDPRSGSNTGDFEVRRNYVTVMGALTDKISVRSTLDVTKETSGGNLEARFKYAYINFADVLPVSGLMSGLEFGVVHVPWIDYEEHAGWWYRAVERTFIENPDAAGLFVSADLGANLRANWPYFSSEVGVFSGEGYDHLDREGGSFFDNALEGRFTVHALGTGQIKYNPTRDKYLDFSFSTFDSFHHNAGAPAGVLGSLQGGGSRGFLDRYIYQFHTVFNMPRFLIAAQYVYDQDRLSLGGNDDNHGFSVNGEIRPFDKWAAFGRVDYWDIDNGPTRKLYWYGLAYTLNQYVRLILNGITSEQTVVANGYSRAMFTVEVNW